MTGAGAALAPEPVPGDAEAATRAFATALVIAGERDGREWNDYRTAPAGTRLAVLQVLRAMPRTPRLMKVIECAEWLHSWLERRRGQGTL